MTNETVSPEAAGAELSQVEKDRQLLLGAKKKGLGAKLGAYTRPKHEAALEETTNSVGGSLVLCSITTAMGFFVFVPTDY